MPKTEDAAQGATSGEARGALPAPAPAPAPSPPKALAIVREDFTLAGGKAYRKGDQITEAAVLQDIRDGDQSGFIIALHAS